MRALSSISWTSNLGRVEKYSTKDLFFHIREKEATHECRVYCCAVYCKVFWENSKVKLSSILFWRLFQHSPRFLQLFFFQGVNSLQIANSGLLWRVILRRNKFSDVTMIAIATAKQKEASRYHTSTEQHFMDIEFGKSWKICNKRSLLSHKKKNKHPVGAVSTAVPCTARYCTSVLWENSKVKFICKKSIFGILHNCPFSPKRSGYNSQFKR